MGFKINDKVKINLDLVNDEFKKYDGVYTIIEIKKDKDGIYLYKLNGVPKWGTEEMIYKI